MQNTVLLGKNLNELKDVAKTLGMPTFTGKQLAEWLYKKRAVSFDEMSNISLKNRQILAEHFTIGRTPPIKEAVSIDGTKKYLFQTAKGTVESVFIPEDDRATLCISSQVGCKMNCLFCMTGKQGFSGNLTASEILNQILSVPDSEKLTNLVYMGMGEPMDNTLEVLRSLNVMTSEWGLAWSPRRITVSTIGLIPSMKQFLEHSECHLAISLHEPFSDGRLQLMPVEKAFPIAKVIDELKKYDFAHQRRLSFEYIVFEGINDSPRHAIELVRLLKGVPCRVNLIRFHAIPNIKLKSPSTEKMEKLRDYLTNNGIICTIRKSRGEDISAACGMLSSEQKNITI